MVRINRRLHIIESLITRVPYYSMPCSNAPVLAPKNPELNNSKLFRKTNKKTRGYAKKDRIYCLLLSLFPILYFYSRLIKKKHATCWKWYFLFKRFNVAPLQSFNVVRQGHLNRHWYVLATLAVLLSQMTTKQHYCHVFFCAKWLVWGMYRSICSFNEGLAFQVFSPHIPPACAQLLRGSHLPESLVRWSLQQRINISYSFAPSLSISLRDGPVKASGYESVLRVWSTFQLKTKGVLVTTGDEKQKCVEAMIGVGACSGHIFFLVCASSSMQLFCDARTDCSKSCVLYFRTVLLQKWWLFFVCLLVQTLHSNSHVMWCWFWMLSIPN